MVIKQRQKLFSFLYIFSLVIVCALIAGTVRTEIDSIPGYRIFLIAVLLGALLGWLLVKKALVVDRFLTNWAENKGIVLICVILSILLIFGLSCGFYADNIKPIFDGGTPPRLMEILFDRLPFDVNVNQTLFVLTLVIAAVLAVPAVVVTLFSPMLYYKQPVSGNEKYIHRLAQAMLPCALISALVFVFGPFEVFFQNPAEVDFAAMDFIPVMLLIWFLTAAILACLISLFPAKFFHVAVSFVFGLAVCGYLQVLLLNLNVGNVNQTVIDWGKYSSYARINTGIWILLLMIPLIIERRSQQFWKRCITFVCVLIFGMQLASVAALSIQSDQSAWSRSGRDFYCLSGNDQYAVGRDGNVIILNLDAFDNAYLNQMLEDEPATFSFLQDFTYYNNYDCSNHSTQPSITCFLTGAKYDTTQTWDDWYHDAWRSKTSEAFYGALARNGYQAMIYADTIEIGDAENMVGLVDNVFTCPSERLQPDRKAIVKGLTLLSLYRLCPFSMKNRMAGRIPDMSNTIGIEKTDASDSVRMPDFKNYVYYNNLEEHGLHTVDGRLFIFQYLFGVHEPIDTGSDCRRKSDATREDTLHGCIVLLQKYIEQLQAVNVYDHSTIIITADHGHWACLQPIFLIKQAGQKGTALSITTAPASHNELQATVLDCIGEDYSEFGPSDFDFYDGELRTRDCWSLTTNHDYPEAPKRGTKMSSEQNTYSRFTYTGNGADLQKKTAAGSKSQANEVLPLTEAPW